MIPDREELSAMEFSVELDSSSPVPNGDDFTKSENTAGDVVGDDAAVDDGADECGRAQRRQQRRGPGSELVRVDLPRFVGQAMIERAVRWDQLTRGFGEGIAGRISPSVTTAIDVGVSAHRARIERAVLKQVSGPAELVRQQTRLVAGMGAQVAAAQARQSQVAELGVQMAAVFEQHRQTVAGVGAQLAAATMRQAQAAQLGVQMAAVFEQHRQTVAGVG
ncbi:hypothetical protein, partial [Pseudonocardia hydrocarbonoxydans]|uniref:hypothetical protein n=1 Tax=Pseudonocardia hydrocarbonoxydans TaxID=76726 RepID=UPI0031E00646